MGKQDDWISDRAKLVKGAVLSGRIQIQSSEIVGVCEDCKQWKVLDPDHRQKRSQGGSNEEENIEWVCRKCHNEIDNMPDSKKQKGKKAEWAKNHRCHLCKKWTRFLLCDKCGRMSVKV